MKKTRIAAALLALFVTWPIWFYLLYKILESVNASELMWFLYWIYTPASILVGIVAKLVGDD